MQLRDRHIQLGFFCVFEMKKFCFAFTQIHADQPVVTTDPVIDMHHGVADFQLRQIANHRIDLSDSFLFATTRTAATAGVQLGFSDERDTAELSRQDAASMQRGDAQHQLVSVTVEIVKVLADGQREIVFAEIVAQGFPASAGLGANHDPRRSLQRERTQVA